MDDEQRKSSLIESLTKQQMLESPNMNKLVAELLAKNGDKEYQDMSQDANDFAKELGNLDAHEILKHNTMQVVLQLRNSKTHILQMWSYISWSR